MKVTKNLLKDYRQVQLRVYKSNGKYLEPIKDWFRIGNEWGLKIKKGQYRMSNESALVEKLNTMIDSYDKKKVPYELMFFDETMRYKDIHNFATDGWDSDFTKTIPRKVSSFLD